MGEPIVIQLPLSVYSVVFVKEILICVLCSLPFDSDRKDVMDKFCLQCGSLDRKCNCGRDC